MIEILFFAHLQESVGVPKINWEQAQITVGELKQELADQYSICLDSVMVAVNEEYADDNKLLVSGDIVAFIPPVSGG